jgi:hypothetical protein
MNEERTGKCLWQGENRYTRRRQTKQKLNTICVGHRYAQTNTTKVNNTWALSSPPVFSGVRVSRSLVLCVCFVDRCLSFCTFSFGHCVVCSSLYGFWLPLWYLQTLKFRFQERNYDIYWIASNICGLKRVNYHPTATTTVPWRNGPWRCSCCR